jgi:hypothetical protein
MLAGQASRLVHIAGGIALVTGAACTAVDSRATRRGERAPYVNTDSMGVVITNPRLIRTRARSELIENSAATLSHSQPDIFFTINDSGNDALLFALDTTGLDRGVWRVNGATNVDWEAASVGPCRPGTAPSPTGGLPNECIYIGDTGDNSAARASRVIYRVPEPRAERPGFSGDVSAEALRYRYADGPHDVEAMYVVPNGDTFLITKRLLLDAAGKPRPALVFLLPADAWGKETAVAQLVDSLPIVPGSAPLRFITDAGLSPDARVLAVRTYAQVYTFAVDPATGRVRGAIPPGVCNIVVLNVWPGEGITWFGRGSKLLLTSEGQDSPLQVVDCPMPRSEP